MEKDMGQGVIGRYRALFAAAEVSQYRLLGEIITPVHRLDPERCYKPEYFFYQNVGALFFYIVYRYIKILISEFNLVYFSASFREKSAGKSPVTNMHTKRIKP